ncbi:hypothetical protein FHR84_004143 [Actinopolyspora biskrensis]|uniref:Uncharacterized protein n=1 Tax=Actinopolyspora biskrensis TaxID=1470178 RepID=A0A852Z612_9ACTN|nr:hypothetical protein [Actinopolyspora biskrensis]
MSGTVEREGTSAMSRPGARTGSGTPRLEFVPDIASVWSSLGCAGSHGGRRAPASR